MFELSILHVLDMRFYTLSYILSLQRNQSDLNYIEIDHTANKNALNGAKETNTVTEYATIIKTSSKNETFPVKGRVECK